jgi:hypothetical protein
VPLRLARFTPHHLSPLGQNITLHLVKDRAQQPEAPPAKAPRNGGWLYRTAEKRGALDWFNALGRERGWPRKIVDWSDGQVRIALDERRKINGATH